MTANRSECGSFRHVSEHVKAVFEHSVAPNTRRAYEGDLGYFWRWAKQALGLAETYPVASAVVERFVHDHLGAMDPALEASLRTQGAKRTSGAHAVNTVVRRLAVLRLAHKLRKLPDPGADPAVKRLVQRERRSAAQVDRPRRKAITLDVLKRVIATCEDDAAGIRDRAMLLVAFASGGRRRSEMVAFEYQDLQRVDGGYTIRLRRSKTDQTGAGMVVPILGQAAQALSAWIRVAGISNGKLFRSIRRDGSLSAQLSDRTFARTVKRRIAAAGFPADEYSAHSLRAGFITESARQRIALADAMALSGHRTVSVALRYYRAGPILTNPAASLAG